MARRHLECHIQAGKAIGEGKPVPSNFKSVTDIATIKLDQDEGVFSLQYSYDGEHLAVGTGNGQILLLNSRTGKVEKQLRQGRYGGLQIMCLRFNPKNQKILMAGTADGRVICTDIESGESYEAIHEKKNEINTLDFDLDGLQFATGGKDLTIRIYDTKKMKEVRQFSGYDTSKEATDLSSSGCTYRVFALKYHPTKDDIFITAGWDNHLKVWDARSRDGDGVRRTIKGPHICGDSLDIKGPEGYEILTGSWTGNNALQTWNYTDGTLEKNIPFPSEKGGYLYCAQYCDNDVVLAGGSGTNSAKAINQKTGDVLGEVKMTKPVHAIDSTFGGQLFAVAGGDNYIKLASLT